MIIGNGLRIEREGITVTIWCGDRIVVGWHGVLRDPSDGWLTEVLASIDDKMQQTEGLPLTLDIRHLEYMNATAFRAIARWLRMLSRRDPPSDLRILANLEHRWQALGLPAMKAVVGPAVSIDDD